MRTITRVGPESLLSLPVCQIFTLGKNSAQTPTVGKVVGAAGAWLRNPTGSWCVLVCGRRGLNEASHVDSCTDGDCQISRFVAAVTLLGSAGRGEL